METGIDRQVLFLLLIAPMSQFPLMLTVKGSNARASQVVLAVKNPPADVRDVRDVGSIPGLGRSPGVGNSNPLQYS